MGSTHMPPRGKPKLYLPRPNRLVIAETNVEIIPKHIHGNFPRLLVKYHDVHDFLKMNTHLKFNKQFVLGKHIPKCVHFGSPHVQKNINVQIQTCLLFISYLHMFQSLLSLISEREKIVVIN